MGVGNPTISGETKSQVWAACQPRQPHSLDLPRGPILGRLSHLNLPGDQHPDPGTPGSQVATVLGRMSLHHDIYFHPQWANQQ